MHNYTFELEEESSNLCTIISPYSKFRYKCLPMGIKQSPNIAQEIMEDIFHDIKPIYVFINNIGVFNDLWTHHLETLAIVLQCLEDNDFTMFPLKCEWAVKETDWLRYWSTPTGLKPGQRKSVPF
jgi:hypothetical protein